MTKYEAKFGRPLNEGYVELPDGTIQRADGGELSGHEANILFAVERVRVPAGTPDHTIADDNFDFKQPAQPRTPPGKRK
jgi:hypothetical protein